MKKYKLGYTEKWLEYRFITEAILANQIAVSQKSSGIPAEEFRQASFDNWLEGKKNLRDEEINQYIELALADKNPNLAGAAIKNLYLSPKITDKQFELIKSRLPEFGDWTKKLMIREDLSTRLVEETISDELFDLCMKYKEEFRDNRLLFQIIETTENPEVLSRFADLEVGKKIRTFAQNKLNKLERSK